MDGLVWLLGGTLLLAAALAPIAYAAELVELAARVRERLGPPAPVRPAPEVRPIEDLAAALRRLRRQVLSPVPGEPMARRRGVAAAYDDLLAEAARALDVPDTLSGLPPGTDREAARLQVEHHLERAGLRLD